MAVARVVRAFTWIIHEPRSFLGVILSVTWACGPPIEMKINHGGTETTEKTLKKLKLRALRVSVVNDFRRSDERREESKDPFGRQESRTCWCATQPHCDFSQL